MRDQINAIKPIYFGKIPRDWKVKELRELTILCTNGFVGKAKESYENSNAGILYIQGYNVTEGGFNFNGIKRVTKSFNDRNKKSQLKAGDLLTIQTGDIGVTTIVPKELEGANCHALIISRFNREFAHPQFYLHFFNSTVGRRALKTIETGSTMKHLNVGDMVHLKLPLPPLYEQKAIAMILDTIDRAIAVVEELVTQKQLRKKWLMQQLLTGKKRLKGFSGEWKLVRIKDVFDEIKDGNDGAHHAIMTISARYGLISQEEKFERIIAGDSLKKYTLIRRNDFAYNKGNSKLYEMGCVYQLEKYESAIVPFVYICFRPTDKIHTAFYKHFFIAHGLDKQLRRIITSGARGDGLLNVNANDFFELKIPYPEKEEQKAVAKILEAADREIELLKTKADKLKQQKKWLMQVLLTGKKRLKVETEIAMK